MATLASTPRARVLRGYEQWLPDMQLGLQNRVAWNDLIVHLHFAIRALAARLRRQEIETEHQQKKGRYGPCFYKGRFHSIFLVLDRIFQTAANLN